MTRNDKRFVEITLILDALNHYRAVISDDEVAKKIIETQGEEFYNELQKAYFHLTKDYESKADKIRKKIRRCRK